MVLSRRVMVCVLRDCSWVAGLLRAEEAALAAEAGVTVIATVVSSVGERTSLVAEALGVEAGPDAAGLPS